MRPARSEQIQFEPTVSGAVRRYRVMVLVVAVVTAAAAVAYTLVQPELYRSHATVTVPQPLLSRAQASDQYLDSQVLRLQSREVAARAVRIANGRLGGADLALGDFSGDHKSLEITPPEGATPGTYGASIITVTFTWPSSRTAQVGANSVLQAFDDLRSEAIRAEGAATVAGIEDAFDDAATEAQRRGLLKQRAQALVDLRSDLARHPTFAWAVEPQVPINGNSKRSGAIGLLVGIVLGAALAFVRASRSRRLDDRLDASAVYGAPLVGEIPASGAERMLPTGRAAADRLPVITDPQSDAAEAFRFTAASIERIRAARGARVTLALVSSAEDATRSAVVSNVALAVADSGARVLAVDARAGEGGLTGLLLPDDPHTDGFQQVIAGRRAMADCLRTSPLHADVAVLGTGPGTPERVTGATYLKEIEEVLAEGKAAFDVVLVDSPALLRVADATEVIDAADSVVVVLGNHEPLRDHLAMVDRLDLVESEVAGYIYVPSPKRRRLARLTRLARLNRLTVVARLNRLTRFARLALARLSRRLARSSRPLQSAQRGQPAQPPRPGGHPLRTPEASPTPARNGPSNGSSHPAPAAQVRR